MLLLFNAGYTRRQHKEILTHLDRSLAPATKKTKETHLLKLVQFCEAQGLNPLTLKEYDVLAYLVHLKKQFKSPGAVSNYLSGARTWTLATTGATSSFDTHHVSVMKKGLARSMGHTPNPVPPLGVKDLRHLARVLNGLGDAGKPIKALLLVAFGSALRQSNLLVNRSVDLPSEHVLLTRDLHLEKGYLLLRIRSSKTIKSPADAKTIKLPKATTSLCCPVRAWRRYVKLVKPEPRAPAFQDTHGTPLTVKGVTNLLRRSLTGSAYPEPNRFTLHALRRGAIHACVAAGSTLEQVKELGQWASRAMNKYLPSKEVIADAPATLQAYIG